MGGVGWKMIEYIANICQFKIFVFHTHDAFSAPKQFSMSVTFISPFPLLPIVVFI